jgi:hypothetical protein
MTRSVELPTIAARGKTDYMLVCDSLTDFIDYAATRQGPGLTDGWATGGKSYADVVKAAHRGDISLVAKSDKVMADLEGKVDFIANAWKSANSVVGGAVNVGAYCAGVPMCMKQRKRRKVEAAPLSIVVDLTVSGSLSHEQISIRGSAILALARLLANVRPVRLYLASCLGGYRDTASTGVVIPIETTPLDLATVANAMTTTGFVRALGYSAIEANASSSGMWPFDNINEYRRLGKDYWQRFVGDSHSELLFVPPAASGDKCLDNPLAWLTGMLDSYGGLATDEG